MPGVQSRRPPAQAWLDLPGGPVPTAVEAWLERSGGAIEGAVWGICTESHCGELTVGTCELRFWSIEAGQVQEADPQGWEGSWLVGLSLVIF